MRRKRIIGGVLAGGKSSRMGQDKSKLKINGQTLLERSISVLKRGGISDVLISHPDHVADLIPNLGPIGGIQALLHEAYKGKYDFLLLVPVDMPGLTPMLIRQLISADTTFPAIRFEDYSLPFKMHVLTALESRVIRNLDGTSNVSLKRFQNFLGVGCLPCSTDNQVSFTNLNTPEEYKNFRG